ncbi:16S rRNA (cytosine(1402)-N(4))-methyltransferase RsmH [Rhodospirillaceae bacterium SYSU D60014]|uniref:16S rRNA (cytosine(1402)-N(4))-methyltransferase RsmH n=1 Tax=Virgifigura deserti TaxID=2268457 RepID=UPI000E670627
MSGPDEIERGARHQPVLLQEVTEALALRDGGVYVDGTFGAGGYARALLEAADCTVWGIDRDPEAITGAAELARRFPGRLHLVQGRFADMVELLQSRGVAEADGIALDLGVSSMQLDEAERGFSFRADGPLDMRMERAGESAADVVNRMDERELADVIFHLGEERKARAIARAIVAARAEAPITRTSQLAEIVRRTVRAGAKGRPDMIDPATRTFQALRIHVNDELGQIERGLVAAETLLRAGGRLVVVSFHSLEDRRVKTFLRQRSDRAPRQSRHLPVDTGEAARAPSFRLLSSGAVTPTAVEIERNPRARSARLRAAERTAAQAWGDAA